MYYFNININVLLFPKEDTQCFSLQHSTKYLIFSAKNLEMYCYQPDYSGFMLLPLGNNLKAMLVSNQLQGKNSYKS